MTASVLLQNVRHFVIYVAICCGHQLKPEAVVLCSYSDVFVCWICSIHNVQSLFFFPDKNAIAMAMMYFKIVILFVKIQYTLCHSSQSLT